MANSHDPILFISGAGLPSWIWDGVRRELHGIETQVASRPGNGVARLRDYAEAAISTARTGRFVVVGHSAGGVVGTEVANLVPQKVAGFLALSAVIPQSGGSFVSAMPAPNRWVLNAAMQFGGTRPPDSAIRQTLGSGLEVEVVDRLIADFRSESLGYYRDRLSPSRWEGPRGYVTTTVDHELPTKLQRRFKGRFDPVWCDEIATGHLPMLEDPLAVADSIRRFLDIF